MVPMSSTRSGVMGMAFGPSRTGTLPRPALGTDRARTTRPKASRTMVAVVLASATDTSGMAPR